MKQSSGTMSKGCLMVSVNLGKALRMGVLSLVGSCVSVLLFVL